MEWTIVVALVIAVPIVLIPVAFVWYLNIGGIAWAVRGTKSLKTKGTATTKMAS
jgi:hypothetical protein